MLYLIPLLALKIFCAFAATVKEKSSLTCFQRGYINSWLRLRSYYSFSSQHKKLSDIVWIAIASHRYKSFTHIKHICASASAFRRNFDWQLNEHVTMRNEHVFWVFWVGNSWVNISVFYYVELVFTFNSRLLNIIYAGTVGWEGLVSLIPVQHM